MMKPTNSVAYQKTIANKGVLKYMKLGIEGDSPDSISQYHSINTDNPRFQQIMYNKGPVDKSKKLLKPTVVPAE